MVLPKIHLSYRYRPLSSIPLWRRTDPTVLLCAFLPTMTPPLARPPPKRLQFGSPKNTGALHQRASYDTIYYVRSCGVRLPLGAQRITTSPLATFSSSSAPFAGLCLRAFTSQPLRNPIFFLFPPAACSRSAQAYGGLKRMDATALASR